MFSQIKQRLPRTCLALLLAAGLTVTILRVLDLQVSPGLCLGACASAALILELVVLTRKSALWGCAGLMALLLGWLSAGGAETLSDVFQALRLRIMGVPGALPLAARETAVFFAVLFTIIGVLCARSGEGSVWAALLVLGALLILWLADRPELMTPLLPAAAAALTMVLAERHREANLLRVLAMAAAVILIGYGATPREGAMIPELKERMDTLRQNVMDRLFFTEPRDVFSLSTEGYYPQGIAQLGGPAHPTDHPVMQVFTSRTAYLRGVAMNEYDGRSWRNTLGGRRYLWDAGGMAAQRAVLFDLNLPEGQLNSSLTAPAEVSVRMLTEGSSTLFVPQRVRELRAGGELVPYFTNSSELFITRNLQPGDTWSVSAPLIMAGDPGLGTLIEAAARGEDPQWEALRETYCALPSHLEEPVWQMAADITANLESDYEKAFAIQNYLSRNYRYTLTPENQPASIDFVTHFLFNTREGYCTYFASAMTVLCRMVGLPARYVEGYLAEPDARGTAAVTGMDAHAWTEVYFPGFGWLTFDATPRRSGGGSGEADWTERPTEAPSDDMTPSPVPPEEETATPRPPEETENPPAPPVEEGTPAEESPLEEPRQIPWLWILLLLLALLTAAAGFRWYLTSPERREKKAASEAERFDLWMEEVTARLAAAGFQRRPGETMMAFTRRMDAEGQIPTALSQLGECMSLLRYGRVNALETDTALARDAANGLKKGLPRKARVRYAAQRLYLSERAKNHIIKTPISKKGGGNHDGQGIL